MSRLKPYTTNQESWHTILHKHLRIPMNQREYSWEESEITEFLDDIFKIFDENIYVLKMGSLISLNYNNENEIYDGQQRTLTIILILKVISCLCEKLKVKINQLLTIDTDLDNLTDEQMNIKKTHNFNIIPKIYCINPYDMEGLVNIFNDTISPFVCHLYNVDSFDDSFDEDDTYICKHCKSEISRKSDFIKHLKNAHHYSSPDTSTKLYSSFIIIYNYFVLKKYNEQKLIDLYKFITNDIDVQYYDCNDPEYVSKIFDWENNRGKAVESLDIIKNPILVKISNEKKVEIYNKWEELKHEKNSIYKKDFGQKIFDIAIQIYNNQINRKINNQKLYKPIIDSENTYKEINKFFDIVEKLFEIMNKISEDKYGRLVNNTSRICFSWEAYMWCLLPIFYITDNIDTKLIKLFVVWYFRNIGLKNRNFNNLCYSNEFIKIVNQVFRDKEYNYYDDIKKCLGKYKECNINDENYQVIMKNMTFKSTNATYLLLFLETCINTDIQTVPLGVGGYTLEHIFSQKNKAELSNQALMDNIGNLTLLEGKNSQNDHKGNSSIGSKTYDKKIESYKGSGSKITRNIVEKYNTFTETTITARSKEMIELLNKYTNY